MEGLERNKTTVWSSVGGGHTLGKLADHFLKEVENMKEMLQKLTKTVIWLNMGSLTTLKNKSSLSSSSTWLSNKAAEGSYNRTVLEL